MAAKRIGTVSIGLSLGTAQFIADADAANSKIRAFGQSTKSSMAASSAAVRELEGGFASNNRAITRFLANTLGLGPALQAAFPLVGAAAFGTMIVETAAKVVNFFKDLREAPRMISTAFRELTAPLKQTNDELRVTNARLDEDIGKLEGRRQNGLKVALAEAVEQADKLAGSLDKDLSSLEKLLKDQSHNKFMQVLFGAPGAGNELAEFFNQKRDSVAAINDIAEANLRAAKTNEEKAAIEKRRNAELIVQQKEINALLNQREAEYEKLSRPSIKQIQTKTEGPMSVEVPGSDQSGNLAIIDRARAFSREMFERVPLQQSNSDKEGLKKNLTDNAEATRPFEDRMKALNATLEASRLKLSAVGKSEDFQTQAKAAGEALKAIEEINRALEKQGTKLTAAQQTSIQDVILKTAQTDAQTTWRTKVDEATNAITDQMRGQELLTAAIGQGYEAVKKANVEVSLMGKVGAAAYDNLTKAADNALLRRRLEAEYDAKALTESRQRTDSLNGQIELERALAQVQSQGAEAIRLVELAYKLREAAAKKGLPEELAAITRLSKATKDAANAAGATAIEQRIAAIRRLTAAQLEGAEAVRKAELENKYAAMAGNTSPENIAAQRRADELEDAEQARGKALQRGQVYKDQLEAIQEQYDELAKIQVTEKNIEEYNLAILSLDRERLDVLVQQSLAQGGAMDGIRAFFLEMQKQAKTTANIIYDALTSALDQVSDQLAKLFTGQKTNVGKMLQGLGESILKEAIKSSIQNGLGAIGKRVGGRLGGAIGKIGGGKPDGSDGNAFRIAFATGHPDGSASNPFYMVSSDSGGQSAIAAPPSGLPGALKMLGGFITGVGLDGLVGAKGGGGENVTSSISFPGRADGGMVSASNAYMVGESGPEILLRSSGRVISNSDSRRMLASGGDNFHTYNIDARGADAGVEARLTRALEKVHNSAVSNSVLATADRHRRVP